MSPYHILCHSGAFRNHVGPSGRLSRRKAPCVYGITDWRWGETGRARIAPDPPHRMAAGPGARVARLRCPILLAANGIAPDRQVAVKNASIARVGHKDISPSVAPKAKNASFRLHPNQATSRPVCTDSYDEPYFQCTDFREEPEKKKRTSSGNSASISWRVVARPRPKRRGPMPVASGAPIALGTGDSSTEPSWDAGPVEAATLGWRVCRAGNEPVRTRGLTAGVHRDHLPVVRRARRSRPVDSRGVVGQPSGSDLHGPLLGEVAVKRGIKRIHFNPPITPEERHYGLLWGRLPGSRAVLIPFVMQVTM